MTRGEFINLLVEKKIPYQEYTEKGLDQVYVYSKDEYEKKQNHPKKYADLYVPYLRVSNFDRDVWYTRENGWTQWMTQEKVLAKCEELGA